MKNVLVAALLLNAVLLAGRIWQELPVEAQQDAGASPALDERFCFDANGDGGVDLSDSITILQYLFTGGEAPYCIARGISLEDRLLTPEELDSLRSLLQHLTVEQLVDGQGGRNQTIRFTGVNVQIVNGLGATNGNPDSPGSAEVTATNGLGNLIVGYQELRDDPDPESPDDRSGSHNIVVGTRHNYSSAGGLVVGYDNTISGDWASVSGGTQNTASGDRSSLSGGATNVASGTFASVSGGGNSTASGTTSSVCGGTTNEASHIASTVSGGNGNSTTGGGDHVP